MDAASWAAFFELVKAFGSPVIFVIAIVAGYREIYYWGAGVRADKAKLEQRITDLEVKYKADITDLKAEFNQRLRELEDDYEKRLAVKDKEVNEWKTMTLRLLTATEQHASLLTAAAEVKQ